ncbi:MAG TPA: HisA/HisF-related TIM barrel protein [Aggregatilineales bacterium]|nr:HisA/HisF-related TIM barrel protein [Aggregatilineales bacterium]
MIEITKGKQPLQISVPVMGASGIFGFAGEYGSLIDLSKLGALITNPVTLQPRRSASGTRVVPLDSGLLIHTGLPNAGVHKVYRENASRWKHSPTPIIVHLIGTTGEDIAACAEILNGRDGVAALEIGLHDEAVPRDVRTILGAVKTHTHLPLLVRLPLYSAVHLAASAVEAGADALVIAAPPRGTARDPLTGQLVGGRLYGPWLKPLALRAVGQVARRVPVPVIGGGGIHNPDDARDFIEAGAVAVQVDSVAWVRPEMVEIIARNLGGLELTRAAGALPDEWHPGLGETAAMRAQLLASPPPLKPPDNLPR